MVLLSKLDSNPENTGSVCTVLPSYREGQHSVYNTEGGVLSSLEGV